MRTRLGYLFGGFLVAFACAVAGLAYISATSTMEGMQRVTMPGKAAVTLPGGPSTLYVEGDAQLAVRCQIPGLALTKPRARVSYSLAGYSGYNAFDVDVVSGGRYELECNAERAFVIAIGSGVGAWIVIAVLALIPLLGGIALLLVTYLRRRRSSSATTPT